MIEWLKNENFLSNERFCSSFIRGKFNQKSWGRIKIRHYLITKHQIDPDFIDQMLDEIELADYEERIQDLIVFKWPKLSGNFFEKKAKLYRFLYQKGFEPEVIQRFMPGRDGDVA